MKDFCKVTKCYSPNASLNTSCGSTRGVYWYRDAQAMAAAHERGGGHHERVAARQRGAVVVVAAADDGGDGYARGRARVEHRDVPLPDARVRELQPTELVVSEDVDARVVQHELCSGAAEYRGQRVAQAGEVLGITCARRQV